VWSWLAGPFALAHYRAYGDATRARALLAGLSAHLEEACLGQVSEIFDGDAPHAPRGCVAQAWSVAESLRAWRELDECETEARLRSATRTRPVAG
jgi:glycogen debranching enzyme